MIHETSPDTVRSGMNESDSKYYSEIKPSANFSLNIKELIDYKELFYFFAWRDIKVKYKQTLLGFLWTILQPLLMMFIFTFFFARALQIPSQEMPYPLFVFSGLNLWMIFASSIGNAGNSMIANAQIIKKIYFPRLIIPISAILVAVFDFFVGFTIFIAMLIFYQQQVDPILALVYWPAGLVITIIASLGPSCLLAALNVKYRDIRYIIPFLLQTLLFVTPVIYPISMLQNQWLKILVAMNPMYAALTFFRIPMSTSTPDSSLWIISLLSCAFFLIVGIYYFRKTEKYFADLT